MDQIYRRKTDSAHNLNVAPNLLDQDFGVTGPNQKWAGDITYIWTREGWLYLAFVRKTIHRVVFLSSSFIDLYSRRVIGWAVSNRLKKDLPSGHCKWRSICAGRQRDAFTTPIAAANIVRMITGRFCEDMVSKCQCQAKETAGTTP